jgi:phosphatidylserine/phosphatidylglycerophosphate/cardiolipin synthase-like enzyme
MDTSKLEIAVTGSAWTGHGNRSIWWIMRDSFLKAQREILIASYSLSEASPEFFNLLNDCLQRGIHVLLIINRFTNQPENAKNNIILLKKNVKDFNPTDSREDLHAKLIIIDHRIALVGSANPTWKGMIINHELMIRVTGRGASEIGNLVDELSYYPDTHIVPLESGND